MKRVAIKIKTEGYCTECGEEFKKMTSLQKQCSTGCFNEAKRKKDGDGANRGFLGKEKIPKAIGRGHENRKEAKAYSIPKVSGSQAKKNHLIAKNKERRLIELGWEICECCEKPSDVDWAHLIPKSVRPDLYTEYENGMASCRTCHASYDAWDVFVIRKFKNLGRILSYIERMDIGRYDALMEKMKNQLQLSR